jgi:hypothetical protein
MRKKDPVFWTATAIFLLSLALAGITRNQLWLFLMVASYLLRPTLASFGIARRSTEERQMSIQYRSGNIAFAVMMATSIGLAIWLNAHDDKSWEMFNIVIMLGLATKALFNVLLQKNYREVGSRIIIAAGLLALLFVTAENGLSLNGLIEAVPWLVIVAIGWLSRSYPRVIATLVFAATAVLLFLILSKGITPAQVATSLLLCVPLSVAGVCLMLPEGEDSRLDPDAATMPRQ